MKTTKEENPESVNYPLQDEHYRAYREYGHKDTVIIREYEPTIMTSCGEVPVSRLERSNKNYNESREKRLQELRNEVTPDKTCPFKGNSMNRLCDKGCSWWNGSGCALVESSSPEKELKGTCPISHRPCQNNCTFWSDGNCKLVIKMVCG